MMAGRFFFFEKGALKFKTYYKPYCRQFRNTDSRYGAGSSQLIENVLKPNRAPGARSQLGTAYASFMGPLLQWPHAQFAVLTQFYV